MKYGLYLTLTILLLAASCRNEEPDKLPAAVDGLVVKEASSSVTILSSTSQKETVVKSELDTFLLDEHEILYFQKGDINADQREDVLLIQKATNEAEISDVVEHPTPRPLMLLLRQPNGKLQLAARNDQVVYCVDCGGMMGDPFQEITISGNYFSIEHFGGSAWRWTKIVTFLYNPAQEEWFLHKDGGQSFHAAAPDSTMKELVKTTKDFGTVRFTDYNIYTE